MKLETILNAYVKAELDRTDMRRRQIHAFRDRILFDFATREATIDLCQQRLRVKDAEIERLSKEIDLLKADEKYDDFWGGQNYYD